MGEIWTQYWPLIVAALVMGLLIGLIALRPRQRVTLSDDAPLRPHMRVGGDGAEGNALSDEGAAAVADVAGAFIGTDVHGQLPGAGDDFQRMKGVGPKLHAMLVDRGITRFEQLAALDEAGLADLDRSLGAFQGRLARDRVIEQAALLAKGDTAGYEARFGKL